MAKTQATTEDRDLGPSDRVTHARQGHEDQALADADQTAALADQEMSGIDQGASDSDQSASALDERNSEHDQANADRTFEQIEKPTRKTCGGMTRPGAHGKRSRWPEENRRTRVRTSRDRDAASGQRDRTGATATPAGGPRDAW